MDSGLQAFEKGHLAFQKIRFNQGKERFKKLVAVRQVYLLHPLLFSFW